MGTRAIRSRFKLCQIWSYYISFEPKFNSEQHLWEQFIVKISHSPVISQNTKITDVTWRQTLIADTYLQCSIILNNHNGFVLGLLIMKNELDDDSNVMIMIEKILKFSVFYVNFPNNFFNCFPNVSCSSTNYLWFVLEYISKMDWDCCLFYDKPKREELRGRVKASSKEKADKEKNKIEETYKKLHHSFINLLNKICFRWKNYLVIIMKRQYSKDSKRIMQSTFTIASQIIRTNWRDLWRKENRLW